VAVGEIQHKIELVVALWIDEDADIQEVVQEMDYAFNHPAIKETEIIDIYTEV
jgi:phenylalanyl-tRNA synthetase beta subunit